MKKLLIFLLAPLSGALYAQTEKAQLSGTISDSSSALIPAARITVTNSQTGTKRNLQSNGAGRYVVSFLDPGTYEIVIQKEGFRTVSRSGIKLDVAQVATLDFTLELGTVSEAVEITAQAPMLDSGSSSLGHLIENKTVVELPLNGRNAYSFATLVPGVRASRGFSQVAYNMFNDQFVSINGSRANQNQFYMDGGTNTTAGFNGPGLFPSVDMVAEYKVQTNNFSAEFSNTSGGVVNVVTKSGTNSLHGNVYDFLRNDKLTANDFFVNRAGRTETPFRFNQFGATAGGPVIRNKTFFFGAYEGLRWTRQTTYNGTVPTELQRAGDFSQTRNQAGALIVIYDPNSTRPDPARAGRSIRTAVPGNAIPASLVDPVARALLRYTPLPNTAGTPVTNTNNYFLNSSAPIDKDLYSLRGDHSFTDNHKIFLRFSSNDTTQVRPKFYSGDAELASPTPGNDDYLQRQVVLSYTAVLKPTVVMDLTSSFLRYWIGRSSPGLNFDPVQLGFPTYMRNLQPELIPCFPAVSVSGLGVSPNITDAGGGFLGTCANLGNSFDTFHDSGNLTVVRGAHTFKTGGNFGAYRWSARNSFTANSAYNFSPSFTQGPDPLVASGTAGAGYASYLFGLGTGNTHSGGTGLNVQTVYLGGYFQDTWKVNARLTLNLGVRYDNPRPWTERFNRITSWCWDCPSPLQAPGLQLRGGLAFPGTGGRSRSFYNSDNNNIAPRFGFGYELSSRIVLRGGFGVFYGPVQGGAVNGNSTPRSGFDASTTWSASLDGITPRNPLSNPFPDGFERASGSSLGLATLLGQGVAMMDPDRTTPYSEQWNLDIQRSLPGNLVIDAAYAGSRGLHLFGPLLFDQLPDQYLVLGDQLRTLVQNPFFGQIRTGALNAAQVQRAQLLRPFPQYNNVVAGNSSYGASTYHSLQLKVERRFSRGVSFMASYTYARVLDDVVASTAGAGFPGETFGDGGLQNYQNRRLERAPAQFDTPHFLALNGIWELPFGAKQRFGNQNGILRAIAGGWQLNGLATFHNGAPLALRNSTNTLGNFGGGQRPNWNGQDPHIDGPASQRLGRYFNTTAFSTPAPFVYGNVARLVSWLRGPGTANVDLSAAKNIRITERFRLQFRFETFNSFNHPEFGLPDTGIGSPNAGVISTQANAPRDIQFGLKAMF